MIASNELIVDLFAGGGGASQGIFQATGRHPDRMQWWVDMEAKKQGVGAGGTFRADREPYVEIARRTQDQGVMDFDMQDGIACDEAWCGA